MGAQIIVVGAGSSGSVIAARISERSDRSVCLIESGPDYPTGPWPSPLADGTKNAYAGHDWGLMHRPTRLGRLLYPFPRGRVVGGSSAVNTCIALRGQPYDYDEWASLGLPDWSWARCLPSFIRLEHDLNFGESDGHGRDGPLRIQRDPPGEQTAWQASFLRACQALGFAPCPDSNAPGSSGAGPHAFNRSQGQRLNAAQAWLTPTVRARENLEIQAQTHVRRVLFHNGRATGVEVEQRGAVRTIRADLIVLCAGAIHTPGLLLRSGIGPAEDLARLGITPIRTLSSVGAKLLDHPGSAIFFRPRLNRGAWPSARAPLLQNVLRYRSQGSQRPGVDMQLQPGNSFPIYGRMTPLLSIMGHVGKPKGWGRLFFPSANPFAKPRIDSRLLEDPRDRALAVQNMALAGQLADTLEMRKLGAHLWPGPKVLRSTTRIDGWIRSASDSGYHPCGTVPMGADDDPSAATDAQGRVRGVRGLRVADASLMPTIPSSNTNIPTLMIGERIGAWIRDDGPD